MAHKDMAIDCLIFFIKVTKEELYSIALKVMKVAPLENENNRSEHVL